MNISPIFLNFYNNNQNIEENIRLKQRNSDNHDIFTRTTGDKTSFQGLTRKLGNKVYPRPDFIRDQLNKHPKSQGIVGSLPHEWLIKIPQDKREETIKELYRAFGDIVFNLRDYGFTKSAEKKASEQINDVLHRTGIYKENQTVSLKRLGSGAFGKAYLIEDYFADELKDKYVIKVFNLVDEIDDIHGNFAETNRGIYWLKNAGPNTQESRFYFADLNNGYMNKLYIYKNKEKPKKVIPPEAIGLNATDEEKVSDGHNRIANYSYEYGGLDIDSKLLVENKTARKVFKSLYKIPEEKRAYLWNKIFDNKRQPNYKDITVGLTEAIKLLPRPEKGDCFNKLASLPNIEIKKILAENIILLLGTEKMASCYKKLAEEDNPAIKSILVHSLQQLQPYEAENIFPIMAKNANNPLKANLADKIDSLPAENRTMWFSRLAENADIQVKRALAEEVTLLPKEDMIIWFNKLAEEPDKGIRSHLIDKLFRLPEIARQINFEKLADNADPLEKSRLVCDIDLLPEEKRSFWFKKLCKNLDNWTKLNLFSRITDIPVNERKDCFIELIKDADAHLKQRIWLRLDSFEPKEKQEYCRLMGIDS